MPTHPTGSPQERHPSPRWSVARPPLAEDDARVVASTRVAAPSVATGLADQQLVSALAEVETLGRRVDALRASLASEAAHRSRRTLGHEGLAARLGCRNGVELVRRVTGASSTAVDRRIRVGSAIRSDADLTGNPVAPRFVHVAAALERGELGCDAAAAIIDALAPTERVCGFVARDAAESELVAAAVVAPDDDRDRDELEATDDDVDDESASSRSACPPIDADEVRMQAAVWREVLDPDGSAPDERDNERRYLTLRRAQHGLIPIKGLLLPEVAASLERYADACSNPRTNAGDDPSEAQARESDATTPTTAPSEDETASFDRRSRAQRLHDVLATIVQVAARAADAPSVAGHAPTLVISVRAEDLASGTGVARVDGFDAPLPMADARRVACTGALQKIWITPTGRVLGIGAPERLFTGHQRRAIALRDGGCVIPGCHVPVGWCEFHHVRRYADDPDGTDTDNGVALCAFHHRTIDTAGWHVRMIDGLPWIQPPSWLDPRRRWVRARPSPTRFADRLVA